MAKKRVLITGATGYISHQLIDVFRERYDLVLLDSQPTSKHRDIEGVVVANLMDPNIDAYRKHFQGVDAIVHNAFYRTENHISAGPLQWLDEQPAGNPDGYYAERDNLDMAFHVFKLALEENVG